MLGLHPMASIETRAPSRSSRSTRAGTAVISFDFSSTASWPSTSRLLVAKADTRCSALWPVLRLWLRREVLPSIATRSSLSGQHCATHDEKQAMKQVRVDPIHHRAQPIGAGNAVVELGKAPQERQMRLSPINNILIVVAARDRPANHEEQYLAQR